MDKDYSTCDLLALKYTSLSLKYSELRSLVLDISRGTLEDPCWCKVPVKIAGWIHDEKCEKLREIILEKNHIL